jgi:hypothetical protein
MRTLVVVIITVGMAGCIPVRGTNERWLSDAEIVAKDEAICTSLGAARGTQSYIDCRLRLRSDRSAEDSRRRWSD